ncbi:hypothetical protein NB706_003598 [Xanthomonas sacchari]|nr:hypothetical protein [Xanthomonas sacchari]
MEIHTSRPNAWNPNTVRAPPSGSSASFRTWPSRSTAAPSTEPIHSAPSTLARAVIRPCGKPGTSGTDSRSPSMRITPLRVPIQTVPAASTLSARTCPLGKPSLVP